jgi:hypothetical protein
MLSRFFINDTSQASQQWRLKKHAEGAQCEEGLVVHRTCALAENFVRWGMREGQSLHITECVAEAAWMKRRRDR